MAPSPDRDLEELLLADEADHLLRGGQRYVPISDTGTTTYWLQRHTSIRNRIRLAESLDLARAWEALNPGRRFKDLAREEDSLNYLLAEELRAYHETLEQSPRPHVWRHGSVVARWLETQNAAAERPTLSAHNPHISQKIPLQVERNA